MCKSSHDSTGADGHSTAGAKEPVTASKRGQRSLAGCRADAGTLGIEGEACSAHAEGSIEQHSSLSPQAGTWTHRPRSLTGDSSTVLAATSPSPEGQEPPDDNGGVPEHLGAGFHSAQPAQSGHSLLELQPKSHR